MSEDFVRETAAKIRETRLAAGLSQKQLAEKIGGSMRQQHISQIEKGVPVGMEIIAKVTKALGLKVCFK